MADELNNTVNGNSRHSGNKKTTDQKGIIFKNDSSCINTNDFKVQLNKDNRSKDNIELLSEFYSLRYDKDLTKEEKTARFKEILHKYHKQA